MGTPGQALVREMNEEIRRLAERYAVADDLDLVCEFLVKRNHVGADERILEEGAHYIVVEKIAAAVEQPV